MGNSSSIVSLESIFLISFQALIISIAKSIKSDKRHLKISERSLSAPAPAPAQVVDSVFHPVVDDNFIGSTLRTTVA